MSFQTKRVFTQNPVSDFISLNDLMFRDDIDHYFSGSASAMRCIDIAMQCANINDRFPQMRRILFVFPNLNSGISSWG